MPPILADGDEEAGGTIILEAMAILQAAESLDAAKSVGLTLEAHLLRLSQLLWIHVERNPEAWADVALRLESPIMFREAVIHLIGKYDLPTGIKEYVLLKQKNGKMVLDLVKAKAAELKEFKLEVERELSDFYPSKMVHGTTATVVDGRKEENVAGRAIYASDIYLWQALTIVRQYINSAYMSNMHHRSADGGIRFYRIIATGEKAYLRKDTLDRFHEVFSMSTKGKQCLEVALDIIKEHLRPIAGELLFDNLQRIRSPDESLIEYLTCSDIEDNELPWNVRAAARARQAAAVAEAADHEDYF